MKTKYMSPVLRSSDPHSLDLLDDMVMPWVCWEKLSNLNDILPNTPIRFFSRRSSDPGYTYRVELGIILYITIETTEGRELTLLYTELFHWLSNQIKAGRRHIGVLIVPDAPDQNSNDDKINSD